MKYNDTTYTSNEREHQEQERGIRIAEEKIKNSEKGIDKELKQAEKDLKESLKEAEQVALGQVQEEVDKLLSSFGVKAKINPTIIRKVLSNIVKHIKEIYFSSVDIQEKIACGEITYEDCRRELRQCVLFNYWSMKKFKTHLKLNRAYESQAKRLIEEDQSLTGSERTIENLTHQVEKAQRLMGKSKKSFRE